MNIVCCMLYFDPGLYDVASKVCCLCTGCYTGTILLLHPYAWFGVPSVSTSPVSCTDLVAIWFDMAGMHWC